MNFLNLSIIFIIIACIQITKALNFSPEFPTNATNFEIVEIPTKN